MSAAEGKRPSPDKDQGRTPGKDRQDEHQDGELDEALEKSFPASDPPSPVRPRDHPGRSARRKR